MIWAWIAAVGALVVLAGYGLHRAATWAERRGWIYYRPRQRPPGPWLGALESIYKPEIDHVIEEASGATARADRDDSRDLDPAEPD